MMDYQERPYNIDIENQILNNSSNSSIDSVNRNGRVNNIKRNSMGNNSMAQLEKLKQGLKACKGKDGFFNPMQAFECLNDIQKQEDPCAYEPEVVK